MSIRLPFAQGLLRPLAAADAAALARGANDRDVWLNLRDAFPFPYTRSDADAFIAHVRRSPVPDSLAIEVDGRVVGVVGATRGTDVHAIGAELGYWLCRACWGRGIATGAVAAFRDWLMPTWQLVRLFALPFADNAASCRVLEKCDFVREGILRSSARKDGVIKDQALYAFVANER